MPPIKVNGNDVARDGEANESYIAVSNSQYGMVDVVRVVDHGPEHARVEMGTLRVPRDESINQGDVLSPEFNGKALSRTQLIYNENTLRNEGFEISHRSGPERG